MRMTFFPVGLEGAENGHTGNAHGHFGPFQHGYWIQNSVPQALCQVTLESTTSFSCNATF